MLRMLGIKLLVFLHDGLRKVKQLPYRSIAGAFLRLAGLPQPGLEGFDVRVMLRCTSCRHVEGGPQASVSRMPNGRSMPDTCARWPGHRCESGISSQRFHRVTTPQVKCGDYGSRGRLSDGALTGRYERGRQKPR